MGRPEGLRRTFRHRLREGALPPEEKGRAPAPSAAKAVNDRLIRQRKRETIHGRVVAPAGDVVPIGGGGVLRICFSRACPASQAPAEFFAATPNPHSRINKTWSV